MLQPKGLYRIVQDTARLQDEARGVFVAAQNTIDTHILTIWDNATSPKRMNIMAREEDAEGPEGGQSWRDKCQREIEAKDGICVYLTRAVENTPAGRVAFLPRSLAKWLIRCGWVREANQADVDAEVAKQRADAPRPIADIGGRLRTARRIHHAMPDGSGSIVGRHPPRRARGVRVPPD